MDWIFRIYFVANHESHELRTLTLYRAGSLFGMNVSLCFFWI